MKTCNRCAVEKPVTSYYKNSGSKDGHLGICDTCVKARQKTYTEKNPEAVAARLQAYHLGNRDKLLAQQKEYKAKNRSTLAAKKRENETGFSPELFAAALTHQGNCCAICDADFKNMKPQEQHADHCHLTGAPRGVLCQKCNTALGKFADSPALLRKAADYLERPPAEAMKLKGYK